MRFATHTSDNNSTNELDTPLQHAYLAQPGFVLLSLLRSPRSILARTASCGEDVLARRVFAAVPDNYDHSPSTPTLQFIHCTKGRNKHATAWKASV